MKVYTNYHYLTLLSSCQDQNQHFQGDRILFLKDRLDKGFRDHDWFFMKRWKFYQIRSLEFRCVCPVNISAIPNSKFDISESLTTRELYNSW